MAAKLGANGSPKVNPLSLLVDPRTVKWIILLPPARRRPLPRPLPRRMGDEKDLDVGRKEALLSIFQNNLMVLADHPPPPPCALAPTKTSLPAPPRHASPGRPPPPPRQHNTPPGCQPGDPRGRLCPSPFLHPPPPPLSAPHQTAVEVWGGSKGGRERCLLEAPPRPRGGGRGLSPEARSARAGARGRNAARLRARLTRGGGPGAAGQGGDQG